MPLPVHAQYFLALVFIVTILAREVLIYALSRNFLRQSLHGLHFALDEHVEIIALLALLGDYLPGHVHGESQPLDEHLDGRLLNFRENGRELVLEVESEVLVLELSPIGNLLQDQALDVKLTSLNQFIKFLLVVLLFLLPLQIAIASLFSPCLLLSQRFLVRHGFLVEIADLVPFLLLDRLLELVGGQGARAQVIEANLGGLLLRPRRGVDLDLVLLFIDPRPCPLRHGWWRIVFATVNASGIFAMVLLGGSVFTDSFDVCFSGALVRLAQSTAFCEHLTSLLEVGAQLARL